MEKSDQELKNETAAALGFLFGARVVSMNAYEQLNREKIELAKQNDQSRKSNLQLIGYYCKFLAFKNYHSKWKTTTRKIEARTNHLIKEGLISDFQGTSNLIKENVEESYKCYMHGLEIAAYIMILRTVELAISEIYDSKMNPKKDFVPAKKKLDWINKNYNLGAEYNVMKAYLEGRNSAVHDIHKPTRMQMLAAFETVNALIKILVEID